MVSVTAFLTNLGINLAIMFILALVLFWVSRILKFERKTFALALLVSVIYTLININLDFFTSSMGLSLETALIFTFFRWIINGIMLFFLIKFIYKTRWNQILLFLLIMFGVVFAISMLIGTIFLFMFGNILSGSSSRSLEEAQGHKTIGDTIGIFRELRLDRQYCEKDIDCIFVDSSCCGCNEMGGNTAINKIYEGEWKNKLKEVCKGKICFIKESIDLSCSVSEPKCHNNRCEIARIGAFQN